MKRGLTVGRFTVIESPSSARERLYRMELRKIMNSKNYYPLSNRKYLSNWGNASELHRFLRPFQNQFNQVNRLYGVENRVKRMIKRSVHEEVKAHIKPHLKKFVKLVLFGNGNTRKTGSPFGTPR
jgi:hypothetical protein